eukprot:1503854-Prymnesium_polylepis.1
MHRRTGVSKHDTKSGKGSACGGTDGCAAEAKATTDVTMMKRVGRTCAVDSEEERVARGDDE